MIKEILKKHSAIRDMYLYDKYRENIHYIDLRDTIQKGVIDKLMNARKLDIPYCVMIGGVVPAYDWDIYEHAKWNPVRDYITTDDIETPDHDEEEELKNIYKFLRGEEKEKGSKHTK